MKQITIKINKKSIKCLDNDSILEVAKKNNIFIPSLCYHPDFCARANCRVCVVEVKGQNKLATACSTKAKDKMEILTDSPKARQARNTNIELIFAEHIEKCSTCIWRVNCTLLNLADRYKLSIKKYTDRKKDRKTYKFANAVEIDGSQCIDCRNCLDACSVIQGINYLELKGKGINQEIIPTSKKDIDCIYCGQCAVHCPVGAAQEQSDWDKVEKIIESKNKGRKKVVIAQFAPSVRVTIGEEFGLPYGKVMTNELIAGLKALGFDYVFDVNFGADMTTVVEAKELVERLTAKDKKPVLPMITSCCPAWVKFVEFYHPELIPNLTTSRSPQMHSGGVTKTYWADKMKINSKDIVIVSIMPCTAKKFEATRTELRIDGNFPVDYTLTVREAAWMMKRKNIDFPKLKPVKADSLMTEYTGASIIYGGSGGVMESALRTAHSLLCGKKIKGVCQPKIEFKEVRGIKGVKEVEAIVAGKKLNIAIINGMGNFKAIKDNLHKYQYIEVMACPGGCIGGGGQPYPTTDEIRQKRVEALYKIDKGKKIRKAHENKGVMEALDWLEKKGHNYEHGVLHTRFVNRGNKLKIKR